jgi:hypothetical protein
LPYDPSLLRNRLESRRATTFLGGHIAISIGSTGHHADVAGSSGMPLAAAAPLHDLRALIFGDDALDLQEKVILRALPDCLVEKDYLNAEPPPFVEENDLIGVAASQAIR